MAIIASTVLTIRDLMAGLKGDKTFDHDIVDLVVQANEMLDDIVVVEANDGTTNKTTIRTGLPGASWVGWYEGVAGTKGAKKQVRNVAGKVKTKIDIDADMYDEAPNTDQLVLDEVAQHVEALNQAMADCLIYGNIESEPKKFDGLMRFYAAHNGALSTDDTVSSHYVFNAKSATQASTEALRSILLVGWSTKSVRCFYPQGSKNFGLHRGEMKRVDVVDPNDSTKSLEMMRQYLKWTLGLDVCDYRYGGRMCNIQLDEMLDTSGVPDYIEMLRRMCNRVRANGVKQCFYMDKQVLENIDVLLARKTQSNALKREQLMDRNVQTLFGIPVRLSDAMATNESEVSQAA